MKQFFAKHKDFLLHCLAFIIALSILGGCVLLSFCFSVPVKATSNDSVYNMYLQSLPGKIIEGPMGAGDGVKIGMQLGLQEAYNTMISTGQNWNASDISTLSGLYYHNNELHFAYTGYKTGTINNSDGGFTLFKSDEAEIRTIIVGQNMGAYNAYISAYSGNNMRPYFSSQSVVHNSLTVSITDTTGTIFQSNANYTANTGDSVYYGVGCWFGSGDIPIIPNNALITDYFNTNTNISNAHFMTGWGSNNRESPRFNLSSITGASSFTFDENHTLVDFILEVYNPWIEENYPDLTIYLFDPADYEDPTEELTECTECGGCNCVHNITVNVDPTINVNVDGQFPSEWFETLPTQETTDSILEELPTVVIQEYTDILQDPTEIMDSESYGFWWRSLKAWIKDNDYLWKYFLTLFTIGVVGAILKGLK